MSFYSISVFAPELPTVKLFLSDPESPVKFREVNVEPDGVSMTSKEFLDVTGDVDDTKSFAISSDETVSSDSETNYERLKKHYNKDEEEVNNLLRTKGKDDDVFMKCGAELLVPTKSINIGNLFLQDETVIKTTDAKGFIGARLKELMEDPDYTQHIRAIDNVGDVLSSNTDITCYVWMRALGTNENQGAWINLSAFIDHQKTFNGENGGNFELSFVPIIATYSESEGWILDNDYIKGFKSASSDGEFVASVHINKAKDGVLKRNQFFFHTVLQKNDLVYLRFERMANEKKGRGDFLLAGTDIPNNNWDMIGLIDNAPQEFFSENNELRIKVKGRDLIKTLIDDGSYFFPLEFARNAFGGRVGEDDVEDGKLARRSLEDGNIVSLNAFTERSLQFTMSFIMNQLSHTGLVDNRAFDGYNKTDLVEINRIKKITKVVDFLEGSSPLGITGIPQLNPSTIIVDEPEKRPADGVYKIINVIIDASVRDRRVVDSSIAMEQGSLLNFVKKICQEPFVEFYTDTYGDQFYFIIRKPPFDFNGLVSLAYDNNVRTEHYTEETIGNEFPVEKDISNLSQAIGEVGKKLGDFSGRLLKDITVHGKERLINDRIISDLTRTINEVDVISENFQYDTTAYSWYMLTPRAWLMGVDEELTLARIPVIPFDRYADVWGSRPLRLITNYISYNGIKDRNETSRLERYEKQAFNDLKYMIDSNQYLPFTRRGTIKIHGNRIFKKGLFMFYSPTGEIFYIDKVEQERKYSDKSSDRTTTLHVSRGMVEKYIRFEKPTDISYFNIINTPIPTDIELPNNSLVTNPEFLNNWKVNDEVFDFFLNRRQWL